jgi:6-phosphogluconolactonase (cycloisomerase 2 family)
VQTIYYPPQTFQTTLAVSPSRKFLYVVEQGCIVAYVIDPATGNLTQSSCSPPQVSSGLAIAPPGNFAYQLTPLPNGSATIYLFSVNQNDGSLALIQFYNVNQGGAMYTDPHGRALYEVIPVFDIDTCSQVVIWQIDPATGTLTNLNTSFSPLCEVFSLVFNSADTFAYVTSGGGEENGPNGIYAATVNATTGNLTSISSAPFAYGTKASFGAVEPSRGKFLMEDAGGGTVGDDGQVAVYAINSNTGALSQVSGAQATLPSPYWYVAKMLAVAPNP